MFWKTNDKKFEQIFKDHITNTVQAAHELVRLFDNLKNKEATVRRIIELEHKGDELVKEAHELLDDTFITRLDKADIIMLLDKLDCVTDFIRATATRVAIYNLIKERKEAKHFARMVCKMTEMLQEIFGGISCIPLALAKKQSIALKDLEEEADRLLYYALRQLFLTEKDWKSVIAWRDVFENLERITDYCEDVINIINSVARKEAR